jgi:hypothetical protein
MSLPYTVQEAEAYIRQAAAARGIDPDVAIRVARSEGLGKDIWQSNVTLGYGRERSYGPFQLHVAPEGRRPGLGNAFIKETGLDPSNPGTWKQGVDYALDKAAKTGWGDWFGAKKLGITGFYGIKNGKALGVSETAPIPVGGGRGTTAGYQKPSTALFPAGSGMMPRQPGDEITYYSDDSPLINQPGPMGTAMGGYSGGSTQVASRNPNVQPAVSESVGNFKPTAFQQHSARQAFEGDPSQLARLLEAAGLDPTGKKRLHPQGVNNPGLLSMLGMKPPAVQPPQMASSGGILGFLSGLFG